MNFCIPKHLVDSFTAKIQSGEITPEKLADMTSKERHDYIASFMGENNASKINAEFESKLLLKNWKLGVVNWAKNVSGIKPAVRRDLISRIDKMDKLLSPEDMKSFKNDLVNQRLGMDVTMEQAGKISDLAKKTTELKTLINESDKIGSKTRLDYGTALSTLKEYVGGIKVESEKLTTKEFLSSPSEWVNTIGGMVKGLKASMDNSFFGKQGFRALMEDPAKWGDAFIKSFGDIGKELKGIDAMTPIKADIYSRPNAINGKYEAIGLDIGLKSEEAFPSTLPEKIPIFKRLYKASETAYNGAALRLRADLADAWIKQAESSGIDVTNKQEGIGKAINFITGRGEFVTAPSGILSAKSINAGIFSVKYMTSLFDTLLAPGKYLIGDKTGVGSFARKKAAINTAKTIGAITGLLVIAKTLDPESVEEDPRSSRFGKIWVGKNHDIAINISLGMNSIVTLASRLLPNYHNGKLGNWVKNSKGQYVNWWDAKFGTNDGADYVYDFMEGKAAPIGSILLQYLHAKNRDFEKPTAQSMAKDLIVPIPWQNMQQLSATDASEDAWLYAVLTGLDLIGVNVNPQQKRKSKGGFK